MNNQTLYRIGGIAGIFSLILSLGYYITPYSMALAGLAAIVFVFALYRLFSASSSALNLVGAILGIGGSVLLVIVVLMTGGANNTFTNLAIWASYFTPPLFYGLLAIQNSHAGMSRTLGIIGLVGGISGLLNLILVLIGGGDWSNPSIPALSPVIMATYYIGMLLTLVWMVWASIVLLRLRAESQPQPA